MNPPLFAWIGTAAGLVAWASASAAVLMSGVWLMREVLGKKLGLGWRSVLGWLVVLRLLCLVAPESRWSWRNVGVIGHWPLVTGNWSLIASHWSLVDTGDRPRGRTTGDSAASLSSPHQPPTHEHDAVKLEPEPSGNGLRAQSTGDSAASLSSPYQQLTHEHDVVSLEPEQSGAGRRQRLTPLADIVAARVPYAAIPWLGLLWFLGAILCFGTAVVRHFVFWRRVRRFSQPLAAGSEAECWLEEAQALLRVRPRVRLRTLEGLGSPVVFGFFRPLILLPPEVAEGLTAAEARHIFLHELAHIRCGDVLANWLFIATRALHWFNPLVWIALRQLVADRELLRDAMALRALPGGDSARREYGHTLLRLAATLSKPRLSPGLASLMHTEKEIQRRIAMIKTPPESTRRPWWQALAGGLAFALVAVTFTVAARGQGAAGAPTELKRSDPAAPELSAAAVDPASPPTDLKAPAVTDPTVPSSATIGELEAAVAAADEADRIKQLHVNKTRLAELDEEIARMTAGGKKQEVEVLTSLRGDLLKEIYRAKYLPAAGNTAGASTEQRKRLDAARADHAFAQLTQSRKAQEQAVERARTEMIELVQQLGIVDLSPGDSRREGDGSKDNIYQSALQLELQTKKEISDFKSQLESIKDKPDEELVGAAANLGIKDPKTTAIYSNYLLEQTKLRQMEELGLGPNHPDVVALTAGLEAQKKQLAEGAKNIRDALDHKLANANTVLAKLLAVGDDGIKARRSYARYHQAKDDHTLQQRILEAMGAELKQMEQQFPGTHPKVLALKAKIEGQQTTLQIAASKLADIETATAAESNARSAYATYHQAKEDYILQQEILQSMVAAQEKARLTNLMAAGAEPKKARFTILGAVARPGVFSLPEGRPLTLVEAIGMAGGYDKTANPAKVSVSRAGSAAPIQVNAKKMTNEPKTAPFLIEPGDVVTVRESFF